MERYCVDALTNRYNVRQRMITANVLFAFMVIEEVKIPYFYKECAMDIYRCRWKKLYRLSPKPDCVGHGWLDKCSKAIQHAN